MNRALFGFMAEFRIYAIILAATQIYLPVSARAQAPGQETPFTVPQWTSLRVRLDQSARSIGWHRCHDRRLRDGVPVCPPSTRSARCAFDGSDDRQSDQHGTVAARHAIAERALDAGRQRAVKKDGAAPGRVLCRLHCRGGSGLIAGKLGVDASGRACWGGVIGIREAKSFAGVAF